MDAELHAHFPLLFEEVDYELLVQSRRAGVAVEVAHRDMRTISGLREVPGSEPSTIMGTLRFRQSVGLTTFHFTVGGSTVDVTLEVFPAKLDYLEDYDEMVADVQEIDRTLPLRYFDETYRRAGTSDTEPSTLDWLSLLRTQAEALGRALRYADAHPLLSMESEEVHLRPDRSKRPTSDVRRAVVLGRGTGGWSHLPQGIRIGQRIPVETTRDTLDSVEHRWFKMNLTDVSRRLSRLSQRLAADEAARAARFRESEDSTKRKRSEAAQQAQEVHALARVVESFAALSIVQEASAGAIPSSFSSLRLLRTPGYADAYRILMALRLGLTHMDDGDAAELSIARLGALYEAWCFVEVLRQVETITGAPITGSLGAFATEGTLGSRLAKGVAVEVRFELPDGRSLAVRYNRSYGALTGVHAPDIELAFNKLGWPELVVLLDAKYRLDTSDEQTQFFGLPSPPQDAIGALHRYRDAIVVDRGYGDMRPVVKGAALYPLSATQSVAWPSSKLRAALDQYGIGAIPLLPNNAAFLQGWLAEVLALPHDQLAAAGPPSPRPDPAEPAT